MPDTSVLVAYCHPGTVSGPFHESLLNTVTSHPELIVGHIGITSGPRIASARNKMVEAFLTHDREPEWLWMLDTDMVFPADTLPRLLDVADTLHPIVGGLCFGGRTDDIFPTLYRLVDPAENEGRPIETIYNFPDDALVKVDATGAACLLIHRRVLENIYRSFPGPHHWFSESVYNGMEFGEDWTFCLRAQQMGHPIHVHTGIPIGHVKPRIIGINDFRAQADM